jgi:cytosine/adenosine deaminase-related metal-dependent hydrolase
VHISIATAIEMQMGHGTPPFQACLNVGILPSLSADVDTNMTPDMFTIMRSAFTLQRALVHARALAGETNLPPLLTCHQVLKMATIAGAVAAHVDHKVGTLTPGKEADIIMLQARALNTWPLNNAPGSVVTMMDTSNVDTVFIAGKLKKWRGKLVGVHENKLLREIEAARDRVFARIQAVPIPVDGLNSAPGYTPSLVGSCCLSDPYDATP